MPPFDSDEFVLLSRRMRAPEPEALRAELEAAARRHARRHRRSRRAPGGISAGSRSPELTTCLLQFSAARGTLYHIGDVGSGLSPSGAGSHARDVSSREGQHAEDVQRREEAREGSQGRDHRPAVRRSSGSLATLLAPRAGALRRHVHRRARLRRLEHPGLPADPGKRHAAVPRPRDGLRRPGPQGPDPEHDLQRARPGDPGAVHPRPAVHRPEGRGLPEEHRHRRHQLLGTGGRVLHLRRRPLRPVRAGRLLLHRLGRGRLEHRPPGRPEPGLQAAAQGRATSPARRPTSSRTCARR